MQFPTQSYIGGASAPPDMSYIIIYTSVGTHGSRTEYGNLATLVTKLKMVTGKGEVITLSAKDENTDMFNAALVRHR